MTILKGNTLSDLHMFSAVSAWKRYLPTVEAAIEHSQIFVFNGDIFDFRRSTLADSETTARAAIAWLEKMITQNPRCQFYYLTGNHDNVEALIVELQALNHRYENFLFYKEYLQLGNNLFLHGDVCDGPSSQKKLFDRRGKYLKIQPDPSSIFLAQIIVTLQLNRFSSLFHPRRLLARKILLYLQNEVPEALSQVKNIFFGHTHVTVDKYNYQNYVFKNGGAAIKNFKFQIVSFDVEVGLATRGR